MPVFLSTAAVTDWLAGQSPESAVVFAARAALRVIPTFKARENDRDAALRMFRCVDAAWAVAAYLNYRDKLVSAASNAFRSVGQNAPGLQKSEAAAIYACGAAAYLAGDVTTRPQAVLAAIDAAAMSGGKDGLKQMLDALSIDAQELFDRTEPVTLANTQLWPMRRLPPGWARDGWAELSATLRAASDEYWSGPNGMKTAWTVA